MLQNNEMKKYIKITVIWAIACLIVIYFTNIMKACTVLLSAFSSLIIGGIIAYILNILLVKLERIYFPKSSKKIVQKSRRAVCVILSIMILIFGCTLFIYVVVPELISSFNLIFNKIPLLYENFIKWVISHSDELPSLQKSLKTLNIDWDSTSKKVFNFISSGTGSIITSIASFVAGFIGVIVQFVIGFIFAIYLLFNKEKIQRQLTMIITAHFSEKKCNKLMYVLRTIHHTFSHFIGGQCTEAVILGSLCAIGMLIFRLPYAVMTGTVIGVLSLIPIIGAYIGVAIGVFMIATVNPVKAVFFIIYIAILQQIEGNLIYPRVVGKSIGLPGIYVFVAVIVGGGTMGIPGILMGVPVAATLYKLIGDHTKSKLNEKNKKNQNESS